MPKVIKNRHRGKRCFIIGSGPSLNKMDLSWLADELTIGSNLVHLRTRRDGFDPTYMVCTDPKIMERVHKDYAAMDSEIVAWEGCTKRVGYKAENMARTVKLNPALPFKAYSEDIKQALPVQGTSVITALALPLALHMGCTKIYLIGCDCTATGHAYDVKHGQHTDTQYGNDIMPAFEKARSRAAKLSVQILNAGVGGKLEAFPRVEFDILKPALHRPVVYVPTLRSIRHPKRTALHEAWYGSHYAYIFRLLEAAGCRVVPDDALKLHAEHAFYACFEGRRFIVDFFDKLSFAKRKDRTIPYFKMHWSDAYHAEIPNSFPLPPVSFYDWDRYERLQSEHQYKAKGNRLLNAQRPANVRRINIQNALKRLKSSRLETDKTDPVGFWLRAMNSYAAVCVPGQRHDILDRGQLQLMAFGVCTLSSPIVDTLPRMQTPKAGVHYVAFKPDGKGAAVKAIWCKKHPKACREIGANAKKLFRDTCTPRRVWTWIKENL